MASKKRAPVATSSQDLRGTAKEIAETRDAIMKATTFSARPTSHVAPPADEADQMWEGVGAVQPPYEPFVLLTLMEHSNSLRQCVDAYVTNIDAFGHRFDPVIDLTASDADDRLKQYMKSRAAEKAPGIVDDPTLQIPDPPQDRVDALKKETIERMREELLSIQHFFEYACLDESFTSLRRKTRQDIETLGNAYWECIKAGDGSLAGFEYIPGFTVRHMPADRLPTPVLVKVKKDLFNYTTVETRKYFRRFVQVFETRVIYFKEFGDPRVLSRKTGAYFASVEELKKLDVYDEPASEIFHFKVHTSKSSYGIPRWIGTILSVLGSRQAEEVNHSYFENKSVPPLALLVSGGRISNQTVDRIKEFIENDIKGKKNFHKILVLEAESPGTSSFDQGRMKIDLKPLTSAQNNDALFQVYDQNNIDKVGMAFRLPRMLRGDIRDFNRSTADAAIEFAEQQVFKPERDEFDFIMNRKILPELGIRFWKFHSNAVEGHTSQEMAAMLVQLGTVGFLVPAEGRDLMEKIFNRPFQKIDDPWVRQPLALTVAGIVPPDQLMAPGMTTPQAAATGAKPVAPGAVGGQAVQGPVKPPPPGQSAAPEAQKGLFGDPTAFTAMVRDLMMLRKAMQAMEDAEARAAFNKRKDADPQS